jgi:charged multivesicular body protein 5
MQNVMMNLMNISSEIQDSLERSYSMLDDIDDDELMGELDSLQAGMGLET